MSYFLDFFNRTVEPHEPIGPKYGAFTVLLSMVFFQLVQSLVSSIYEEQKWKKVDFWTWRNIAISAIHAGCSGSWVIIWSVFANQ